MITFGKRIPISIQPLFWLVALFIGWMWTQTLMGAILCIFVIFSSVLFHEFGHALTALAFGQKVRIELAAFGGFTYRQGDKLPLWKEFLVVLNGPIAGFILFVVAYLLFQYLNIQNSALSFLLRFTFVANLFWTIMNLVPVLPLDGGHLMSIILEALFGFKGVKMAIIVGIVIAIVISIFFFILGQFLIGALFLILTFESFRSLRYYKIFSEKDRDQGLQELVTNAQSLAVEGKKNEALQAFQKVREKSPEGVLYTLATEQMAQIYKERREYESAYELLLPIRKDLSSDLIPLLHFLAYVNGDLKVASEVGNQAYQNNPTYETALINACLHATRTDVRAAVGWLECCVRDGIPSITDALARPEFDEIRDTREFNDFVEKVKGS